jgi:site-specific DNA recombinase
MSQNRCAIYIRVSSEMQVDGHSLDAQRDICTKFAEGRGWKVVRIFEGQGESAKTDQRRAFQEMVEFVRAGHADIVLTHKLDRFARNVVDALTYLHEFNQRGVSYCSATEQFDFTTPWGKMQLVMLAAFAELFLNNLSAETKKGKRKRAEKGLWNGDLPFGYQKAADGKNAEPHPEQAAAVRAAFKEYATGTKNDLEIAKMLNRAGCRTQGKRGAVPFSRDAVRSILQNIFYTGKVSYKGEFFPGQHPAIISTELFEQCQAVRRRLSVAPAKRPALRVYPLAGLIYCGYCKRPLSGQGIRSHRYYRDRAHDMDVNCKGQVCVSAEIVENAIGKIFCSMRLPESWRAAITSTADATFSPENIQRQRQRIESRLARAKELYIEGAYTRIQYENALHEAEIELDALKPLPTENILAGAKLLDDLPRLWAVAKIEEKKTLLRSMIERVFVLDGRIIAIQPTPYFYPLFEQVLVQSGPDERPALAGLQAETFTSVPKSPTDHQGEKVGHADQPLGLLKTIVKIIPAGLAISRVELSYN